MPTGVGQTSIVHSHYIQSHPGVYGGHNPLYIAKNIASQTSLSNAFAAAPLQSSQASLAQSQISFASSAGGGGGGPQQQQQNGSSNGGQSNVKVQTPTSNSCADLPF